MLHSCTSCGACVLLLHTGSNGHSSKLLVEHNANALKAHFPQCCSSLIYLLLFPWFPLFLSHKSYLTYYAPISPSLLHYQSHFILYSLTTLWNHTHTRVCSTHSLVKCKTAVLRQIDKCSRSLRSEGDTHEKHHTYKATTHTHTHTEGRTVPSTCRVRPDRS